MHNRNREVLQLSCGALKDASCCRGKRTPTPKIFLPRAIRYVDRPQCAAVHGFYPASRNRSTLVFVLAREIGLLEALRITKAVFSTVLLSKVTSMATER